MVAINNSTTPISYRQNKITVPANKSYTLYQTYNTIRILESNAVNSSDLLFRFGALSTETEFSLGLCITYPEQLPSVTITNTTNSDINIVIATAVGTIQDDRLTVSGTVNVSNYPYTNISSSLQTFPANGIVPIDSSGYKRVVIQNSSDTSSVFLFANNTFELQPQAVFDMDLSTTFNIYGTSGQTVSVALFN